MSIEELAEQRGKIAADVALLKEQLIQANSRVQDALRDLREAERGFRFGQPVSAIGLAASKSVLGRARDEHAVITSRLIAGNAMLKRLNIQWFDLVNETNRQKKLNADEPPARRASKPSRSARALEHEARVIVLLQASRGVVSGADRDLWMDRFIRAVDSLAYCDTSIDGVQVTMPWDEGKVTP